MRLNNKSGVTKGDMDDDLELDPLGDDDFDAEAFLDVKQENLEEVDIFAGANQDLMDKYIQVLQHDYKKRGRAGANLPPPKPMQAFASPKPDMKPPHPIESMQKRQAKNSALPPISPMVGQEGGTKVRDLSKPKTYNQM